MRRITAISSSGPGSQSTWWPALDVFALGQRAYRCAVGLHQPAAKTVRRSAAGGKAGLGQIELGIEDLLRQIATLLAGAIVVNHGDDGFAQVPLTAGQRRQDLVHENQRHARLTQAGLHLHGVERIIGTSKAVAARDEDVRDVEVGPGEAEQRIQAGTLQLIALDAIVEEEIAVLRAAVADHGLDVLGRAAEADTKGGGLALSPAHIFAGSGFMFAAGVAGIEESAAQAGPLGCGRQSWLRNPPW